MKEGLVVIGELSLWIALLFSGWGAAMSGFGSAMRRPELLASGRRALAATAVALTLALAGLWQALRIPDFTFSYVVQHATFGLSAGQATEGLWGGGAGALLLTAWMSAVIAAVQARHERNGRVNAVMAVLICVALAIAVLFANPYARIAGTAVNGAGVTPWMRHPGVIVGRFAMLMGYAAGAVALATAPSAWRASASGALAEWRKWVVAAWTLLSLSLGLLLRAAWLHTGIAGLWYPSPEIIGAALVWLAAAAVLHPPPGTGPRVRTGRVGQQVADIGAILVAVAFFANFFTTTRDVHLPTGTPVSVSAGLGGTWQLSAQGLSQFAAMDHGVSALSIQAAHGNAAPRLLVAQQLMFGTLADTTAERAESDPALVRRWTGGLRVVLMSADDTAGDVRVSFVPFAWLLDLGALLCVVGGAATLAFSMSEPREPA